MQNLSEAIQVAVCGMVNVPTKQHSNLSHGFLENLVALFSGLSPKAWHQGKRQCVPRDGDVNWDDGNTIDI